MLETSFALATTPYTALDTYAAETLSDYAAQMRVLLMHHSLKEIKDLAVICSLSLHADNVTHASHAIGLHRRSVQRDMRDPEFGTANFSAEDRAAMTAILKAGFVLEQIKKLALMTAIQMHDENKAEASRTLGLHRKTIYRQLEKMPSIPDSTTNIEKQLCLRELI